MKKKITPFRKSSKEFEALCRVVDQTYAEFKKEECFCDVGVLAPLFNHTYRFMVPSFQQKFKEDYKAGVDKIEEMYFFSKGEAYSWLL